MVGTNQNGLIFSEEINHSTAIFDQNRGDVQIPYRGYSFETIEDAKEMIGMGMPLKKEYKDKIMNFFDQCQKLEP